jgi:Prolyl oligopeptidase family
MVDYFNTDAAALASRGYVVIAPNPRGSTGYGIDFQNANHQDLGEGDLQDEVPRCVRACSCTEHLRSTGGILGGLPKVRMGKFG